MLKLRLSVLLRALSSLVLNGNGHELVGARLALELVLRFPRRTLEVAGFTVALLSWLLVAVGVVDAVLGLGVFPEK
jgi:hypothetical protein